MNLGLVFLTIGIAVAPHAKAGNTDYASWARDIVARLPFVDGQLDRERYNSRAASFAAEKHAYHDAVFGNLIDKASRRGNTAAVESLKRDRALRSEQVDMDIRAATEGVMSTLDPENSGSVGKAESLRILMKIAEAADLDDNGRLDRDEQRLAEWSLTTGNPVADKADARGIDLQFFEMDSNYRW
jgi:hypothetical protein